MPIYRIQAPDGSVLRIEGPEGATAEQLQGVASRHFAAKLAQQQFEKSVSPTADMGMVDRLRAGIGSGMTSAARAALQGFSKLVGADAVGAGLVNQSEIDAAKKEDAPLIASGAGRAGNFIGQVAAAVPTALIPGANTYLGATLIGAGVGGLTTDGGLDERMKGAAFGAAGGAAGKALGDALGAGARWVADRATQRFAANQATTAPRMAAAKAASEAGYVIPPADLQPGAITEALSGLSGKIKTAQVASQRNQLATNDLARRAVGIPEGAPITQDSLAAIRANAGKAYDAVRGAGPITADQQYGAALDNLAAAYKNVVPDFPQLARSDVPAMMGGLKKDGFDASVAVDAIRALRARADQAFRTGDNEMGKAAKAAASELEALIERNLQARELAQTAIGNASGKLTAPGQLPGATLSDFRDARQLMAKTYTLQKALNNETGDVSAQVLARDLAKGKPLSGELQQIAQIATAFPKATQALKEAPKATSPLDWALGGMSAGMMNPVPAMVAAARPAARSLLLSPMYQRAAVTGNSGPGLLTQMPAAILDQNLTRAGMPGLLAILAARATAENP